jgi:hypothetical protein
MSPESTTRRLTLIAASCLVLAPVVALASTALAPTMSDDASAQLKADAAHHGSAVASVVLEIATVPLLVVAVLALTALTAKGSPAWARVGGALGLFGVLDLLFIGAVSAVQLEMVTGGAERSQMVALTERIQHSAIGAAEPLTVVLAAGLVILADGLRRAKRISSAAAAAIALGAVLEPVGFATGTRAVAILAFLLLLAGFGAVARSFVTPAASAAVAADPRPAVG